MSLSHFRIEHVGTKHTSPLPSSTGLTDFRPATVFTSHEFRGVLVCDGRRNEITVDGPDAELIAERLRNLFSEPFRGD